MPISWYISQASLSMGSGSPGRWVFGATAVALAVCVWWYLFQSSGATKAPRRVPWRRGLLLALGSALVMLALLPLVWPSVTSQ